MTSDLRAELESLVTAWLARADSGVSALYPGQDYRHCAEDVERLLLRHADTDRPPTGDPPSERPTIEAPEPV